MNKKNEELLEAIRHLERQVFRLSDRLRFFEYILKRYGYPPFPPVDEEDDERLLRKRREYRKKEEIPLERWMKENRDAIVSTSKTIQRLEISPQDATLHMCSGLMDMTSYLAAKCLLGSCECGGQLQLLVEGDNVYITCARCGRWLWQELKHE